jgi:hypothetical protein
MALASAMHNLCAAGRLADNPVPPASAPDESGLVEHGHYVNKMSIEQNVQIVKDFFVSAPTKRSPLSDQNILRNAIPTVRPYGSRNAG